MNNFLKTLEEEFGLQTALNFIRNAIKEEAYTRSWRDLEETNIPYNALLFSSFGWAETIQGHSFWVEVYEFLVGLPKTRKVNVEEVKKLLDFYRRDPNMKILT